MSRLIVLSRHGSVRQVNIKGPITTIGRDPSCGVHIDSLGVSRHHAAIHWTGDRFVLTDLASRNGTFVNKVRIRERALANGDAISTGDCQLRFLYETRALPAEEALRLVTLSHAPVDSQWSAAAVSPSSGSPGDSVSESVAAQAKVMDGASPSKKSPSSSALTVLNVTSRIRSSQPARSNAL